MLVVIFVLALWLAVLVPGVNGPRAAGRRTQCVYNMRQLGLALLGYANAKGHFPNAGTFYDDPSMHEDKPARSNIGIAVVNPGAFANANDPLLYSWVVDVLPYVDIAGLYNAWDKNKSYLDTTVNSAEGPSNHVIATTTAIGILRCPADETTVTNQGNLSYAVNGGFLRWPALPIGWQGSANDGQSKNGPELQWFAPDGDWRDGQDVGKMLGVMFLGTHTGDQPWDIKTRLSDLADGASTTVLIGENTNVGYSKGSPYAGGLETNWACPLPNFCMFLASDDVCRSEKAENDCLGGQLQPVNPMSDGPGWARANPRGKPEAINSGLNLTVEGSSPFVNSAHPGGANFTFCDGSARFVRETIDGAVYAKIITPAGSKLPQAIRQLPLNPSAYESVGVSP